jgi:hypothetical protein
VEGLRRLVAVGCATLCACTCSKKTEPDAGVDAGLKRVARPSAPLDAGAEQAPPTLAEAEALFAARGIGGAERRSIAWECSTFGATAVCLAARTQGELGAPLAELEAGNDTSTFTHVRLLHLEHGQVTAADWPAPVDALFSPPGDEGDCWWQCDEGGYPQTDRQPDEPSGVGTGSCYAGCAPAQAAARADTLTVNTTLELIGALGDGRFAFRRTITRARETDPSDDTEETAEEIADETLVLEEHDVLLLHHPGGGPLLAAEVETFDALERPSSAVWLATSPEGTAAFVTLDDGRVLSGEAACHHTTCKAPVLESKVLPPAERPDGDVPDFKAAAEAIDEARASAGPNPYVFKLAGWRPPLAWYDTTYRNKSFTSVLAFSEHGVKAFLLAQDGPLWALGEAGVAGPFDGTLCAWSLVGGDDAQRATPQERWCGPGQVVNVDDDPALELLSEADGGVTVIDERGGKLEVREGLSACARITRPPSGFFGCPAR